MGQPLLTFHCPLLSGFLAVVGVPATGAPEKGSLLLGVEGQVFVRGVTVKALL